jgi:hypothetical protein
MGVLQYVNLALPGSWTGAAIGIMNSGGIRTSITETTPGGSMYTDRIRDYSMLIYSYAILSKHPYK